MTLGPLDSVTEALPIPPQRRMLATLRPNGYASFIAHYFEEVLMRPFGYLAASLLVATFFTAPAAAQQQPGPGLPSPRLLQVMPPGGKAGSTVEITLSGQDLDEAHSLKFSQPGIKSELIPAPEPDPKKPA